MHLNNNRFNHKHCQVSYCHQLPCGEILTVVFCLDLHIIQIMVINRFMQMWRFVLQTKILRAKKL